jgi:hypothetical protein
MSSTNPPDDDFKRASLHGRGKKIIHGNEPEASSQQETADDAVFQAETDEIDALFATGDELGLAPPPTPSTTSAADASETPASTPDNLDFANYALDFFPADDEDFDDDDASIQTAPDSSSFEALNVASNVSVDDMPENDAPLGQFAAQSRAAGLTRSDERPPDVDVAPPDETFALETPIESATDDVTFDAVTVPGEATLAPTAETEAPMSDARPGNDPNPEAIPASEATQPPVQPAELRGAHKPAAGAPVLPTTPEIVPEQRPPTPSEQAPARPTQSEGLVMGEMRLPALDVQPANEMEALLPDNPIPAQQRPSVTSESVPTTPAVRNQAVAAPAIVEGEGVPLVEDLQKPTAVNLDHQHAATDRIQDVIPQRPETAADARQTSPIVNQEGLGGVVPLQPATALTAAVQGASTIPSPFGERRRPPVEQLFKETQTADPTLLATLVDDARLYELWNMIEILQEEIAERPSLKPARADTYQKELLQASDLILQSRENYDDARAIVFRIRADLRRDDEISADIERYNSLLMTYIIGWFGALIALAILSTSLSEVLTDADAIFVANAFTPTLFGAAGGLFLAYTTLNRHVTVLRDFDKAHVWWYFASPFIGALMGFMTYTLWVATVFTTDAQDTSNAVVWVLAFIGGLQQNWVIGRLRAMRGSEETSQETTPRG